jgi:RND family efflux transporter MFP subunit
MDDTAMKRFGDIWQRRKKAVLGVGGLFACSLIFGAIRIASSAPKIPTTEVKRKEFVEYVQVRGEVKALQSVFIVAPYRAGDLQIIKISPNGTRVKKGDVILEFDNTTAKQSLAQDQSALKSADAEIQQAKASARLKEEQDLTDVMKARFEVQTAKLDVSKGEIVSAIEGEEARLKLADAEQKLKEAEAKLNANRSSTAADFGSKQQKRDRAAFQVQQDQITLDALTLRAPIDGMVSLMSNWRAAGPMGIAAPFKQGDRAWPGASIAELPDPSALKITGRIDETERGQMRTGQAATIRLEGVPDRSFDGHVEQISTTASMDFSGGWPFPHNFGVEVALNGMDSRLSPGMSANVRVAVDRISDGIVIPAQALFRKAGRSVTYVRHGSRFDETTVEVSKRSGDDVLIAKGLHAGEQVALKDPNLQE